MYLLIIELNLFLILCFIVFLYIILNLFSSWTTGFTWFLDWISRVDVNESFINSYNFFWTTFLYLPSFFFLILLINFLMTSLQGTRLLIIYLLVVYLIYNLEILDFLLLNLHLNISDISITSINLLLTNNLNKYHPLIFYISVILLFNLLLRLSVTFFNNPVFNLSQISIYTYSSIYNITSVNLFALFLGSWWALQEGTWGGWWNWDPSEVLGLLFTLTGLLYIHSNPHYFTYILNIYRVGSIIILIMISYLFIQLNFDLVSHNFGSKFFFFFNNNLFFLELLLMFLLSYIFFMHMIQNTSINTNLVNIYSLSTRVIIRSNRELWLIILYGLLFLLILFSFIPLINYFLWVYYRINSLNLTTHTGLIVILTCLILMLPFSLNYRFDHFLIPIIVFSSTNSLSFIIIVMLTLTFNYINGVHLLLTLLIVSNLFTYNTQFLSWNTLTDWGVLIFDAQLIDKHNDVYICGNYFIDKITVSQTSLSTILNTWSVFYLNNSLTLNNFSLIFNSKSFVNIYYLANNWQTSTLFIETNYLNNMLEILFWITLTILNRWVFMTYMCFYKTY